MIYLDYNASTPVDGRVVEALLPYLREHFGNPSAGHGMARAMRQAVQVARGDMADAIGADEREVVFTSGGTEACNHAIKGAAWARQGQGRHMVLSSVEHPAVSQPMAFLAAQGWEISRVAVDGDGRLRLDDLQSALRAETVLVAVMLANNEVGTVQPVGEVAGMLRERYPDAASRPWLLSDASQAIGKIAVDVKELGVDLLVMAGHKFYAPQGVGALYVRRGVELVSLHHGADHERGRRAGTEPVAQIVGLGAAARLATRERNEQRMTMLRERLLRALRAGLGDGLVVNGEGAERLPNTLNVSFVGWDGATLLSRCPALCATTGAACHTGFDHAAVGALAMMGASRERQAGAIRLSVGRFTTEDDVDRAAQMLLQAIREVPRHT